MPRVPLTVDAIVSTAAALADEVGVSAVTLSAVARSLGVQTPSLYGHVADLAALRDGMTIRALAELSDSAGEAIAGRSGRDALRALCDAHRDYARTHPGGWESLQRRAGEAAVRSSPAARSGQVMAAVLRGYGVPEADRVHATRLVAAFLNGFIHLEHVGGFSHSAPASTASWSILIDRVDGMLRDWGRAAASTGRDHT